MSERSPDPRLRPQLSVPSARRASPEQLAALKALLARAFSDDPVTAWACPPLALRAAVLERFYATLLPRMLAHGDVWTTGEVTSAALWRSPEHWQTTAREDLSLMRSLLHPRLLHRLPLVSLGLLGVERRHPRDPPHWYLATLGTEPALQGTGLGSAVLRPVLEQCDSDGVGAYLESSKERNIAFYARHGFRVRAELRLPQGPPLWAMWREPRH